MLDCWACGAPNTQNAVTCAHCGSSLDCPDEGTVAVTPAGASESRGGALGVASGVGSSASGNGDQLAPGALLAQRYRIVGLLGRGGMGEVYRADDLTLGQAVALKFLPEVFQKNPDRRQRFLREVSLARQVSHPNVCRVYDVGEVDGKIFLSMEFVDGEDLASLLRRIGRLPQEKAVDIARQLCAGLSTLHERDLLHRDLKPANVMLDGRGRVRITDFGLAGVAQEITGAEIRSGTPQYMAPEQLEGREVTRRSDIYSLGLVLYEVFTGAAAVSGDSLDEISKRHQESTPTRVSTLVPDADPAVERVIERCLEKDPQRRPSSAIAVATALPGGDPVAAALAMGETPSPELVAAAGGEGGLHPALGLGLLLLALAGLVVAAGVGGEKNLPQTIQLDRSAAALEERARQIAVDVGYDERPVDRVASFASAGNVLNWIAKRDSSQSRWAGLDSFRPAPILLWYRQSPRHLVTQADFARVTPDDPPPVVAGMLQVTLDVKGRLVYFDAVPPEQEPQPPVEVPDATWDRLFHAADLDRAQFEAIEPTWLPGSYVSERHAWSGVFPGEDGIELTVEAGGVGGKPVLFRLHGPWSTDVRTVTPPRSSTAADLLVPVLIVLVLVGAAAWALRNFRAGRTDGRSAVRLAMLLLCLPLVRWLFGLHHVPRPGAILDSFFDALSVGALFAVICIVLYAALEPFARRVWPQIMIGWVRLLTGRFRDPMVGRSLLVGAGAFGFISLLEVVHVPILSALGVPPPRPESVSWWTLASPRSLLADVAMQFPASLFNALFFLMLLVFFRMLLRRRWPGYIAFLLLSTFLIGQDMSHWSGIVVAGIVGIVMATVMVRVGLLAFVTCLFLLRVVDRYPLTFDFQQMHIGPSLALLATLSGLFLYGLITALAGRSFLKEEVG